MVLHKGLFILSHQCGDASFYLNYKKLVKNQWKPYSELKHDQEIQLRHVIEFSYSNIPYYHNLFKGLGLMPSDIKTLSDLNKIPILTKKIIKQNWEQLKPVNLSSLKYYERATGGSTGTPLHYRLSKQDRFFGGALLYRGWGYGGYQLGNKMIFLAGASLNVGNKSKISKFAHETARNIRMLSSFDMGQSEMQQYVKIISSSQPCYIRGYASSLYFLARWMKKNGISAPSTKAVMTTAEKLSTHMRNTISNVFDCEVFDNYGLNDGGISAYECPEHIGLHIDTERSIMEIVDEKGMAIEEGRGQIIATSLHNYAMPFIRYFTGDEGHLLTEPCTCGRGSLLLKEVLGRQQEMLSTPGGQFVHGEFISHMMWEIPNVKEFQVIQDRIDHMVFRLVVEEGFNEGHLDQIRDIVNKRNLKWDIEFQLVDSIEKTGAGKYKFIINELMR